MLRKLGEFLVVVAFAFALVYLYLNVLITNLG